MFSMLHIFCTYVFFVLCVCFHILLTISSAYARCHHKSMHYNNLLSFYYYTAVRTGIRTPTLFKCDMSMLHIHEDPNHTFYKFYYYRKVPFLKTSEK